MKGSFTRYIIDIIREPITEYIEALPLLTNKLLCPIEIINESNTRQTYSSVAQAQTASAS